MRFGILLFEGCEELDVFGPYEALQAAARLGADFELQCAVVAPTPCVTMALGTRLENPETLALRSGDWLIVPGGGWLSSSGPGVRAELQKGELPKMIADWRREGVFAASVCTGAMLLAAAGLTKDRVATTHHGAREELRKTGALVVDARVVDDGDLVTAGGVSSGIDLGIWLTERFAGKRLAQQLQDYLEYPCKPDIHLGPKAERSI